MFGHEIKLPIDLMFPNSEAVPQCPNEYVEWLRAAFNEAYEYAREKLKTSAVRQKTYYDQKSSLRKFQIGDWVWVFYPPDAKEKLGRGWKGPYLIVEKWGDVNYKVQPEPNGKITTVHVDHINIFISHTPECWISPQCGIDKSSQVLEAEIQAAAKQD
jgi:uncharacterized GH25 family protein